MLVQTESDRWVIPPQRALWLPPLHIHSYHLLSQTDLRAIYFSSSLIAECMSFTKSHQVHVITATSLVKELIAGLFSEDYATPIQRKIALLLLEILSEAPPLTMALPMPNDERLFSAARSLLVNQRWEASLSELAFMSAMSERTFSRLFMKDTGFSFRTWKQRARIYASLIFSRTAFQSNRSLTSLVSHARRHLPLLFVPFLIQRRAILCLKPGNHNRFLLIAAVRIFCTTKRGWQGSHLRGTESP